jgi:hypothetical protein
MADDTLGAQLGRIAANAMMDKQDRSLEDRLTPEEMVEESLIDAAEALAQKKINKLFRKLTPAAQKAVAGRHLDDVRWPDG